MNITKEYATKELQKGICELTIVSEHSSMSRTISVTLSPNHLPDTKSTFSSKPNIIVMWNMVDEEWQSIHLSTIGDVERLTGLGVKDEKDAISIDEITSSLLAS